MRCCDISFIGSGKSSKARRAFFAFSTIHLEMERWEAALRNYFIEKEYLD